MCELLGIVLDDDLKWEGNTNSIYTKANKKLFMLRLLKRAGLCAAELVAVYKCYIRPLLEYAAPVWHPGLTQEQSSRIEKIQRRVCRCILGKNFVSYKIALGGFGLETLSARRDALCAEFAKKALNSIRFNKWFPLSNNSSIMTLRKSNKFKHFNYLLLVPVAAFMLKALGRH